MSFLPARRISFVGTVICHLSNANKGLGCPSAVPAGIRGAVRLLRSAEFVESARAAGATGARIILRHLLPNIVAPMLVFVSLNIGWMITETAGLSFLGLGAQPPTPDLSTMLADGHKVKTDRATLQGKPR